MTPMQRERVHAPAALESFAIGSCASTITSVFTKKMMPIAASLTPASFFAADREQLEAATCRRRSRAC